MAIRCIVRGSEDNFKIFSLFKSAEELFLCCPGVFQSKRSGIREVNAIKAYLYRYIFGFAVVVALAINEPQTVQGFGSAHIHNDVMRRPRACILPLRMPERGGI